MQEGTTITIFIQCEIFSSNTIIFPFKWQFINNIDIINTRYYVIHTLTKCFNIYIRYTNQMLPGDEVLIPISNVLIPTKVIDVSNFMMQGKYQPKIFFGTLCTC